MVLGMRHRSQYRHSLVWSKTFGFLHAAMKRRPDEKLIGFSRPQPVSRDRPLWRTPYTSATTCTAMAVYVDRLLAATNSGACDISHRVNLSGSQNFGGLALRWMYPSFTDRPPHSSRTSLRTR